MRNHIPHLDAVVSNEIWEDMFHLLKEADMPHGASLCKEGEYGTTIYFLCEGVVNLEKKVDAQFEQDKEVTHGETFPVVKRIVPLCRGSVFGEEILQDHTPYKYTAKVESASALVYYCEKL